VKRIPLVALLACTAALAAAENLPFFAHSAPLLLDGKGALYALTLPTEAYRGIARRDLGDVRVLNGAGEVVPHALERQAASEKKAGSTLALAFFPLQGAAGRPVEDLKLTVERRPDGTLKAVVAAGGARAPERRVVGYVIDASAATAALRELRFEWPAGPEGSTIDARLEAGDDLRSWHPAGGGPLIVLRRGEAVLERRTISLAPQRAKYFRLSWRAGQDDPKLTAVVAQSVDAAADTPRAWLRFEAVAGAKPGEYVFELPQSIPVERLRFDLPQENTVVSASLVAQDRDGAPERRITSAVLYRMAHGEQKLVSPELQIAPTAEKRWVLRVDPRGGGLGSGLPVLHAGWVPHRLVFVARGGPPFQFVFGNADARSGAMPVQALVPGHATDKPVPALAARLGEVRTQEPPKLTTADTARGYFERMDRKKLWLWGSLLLAVLVIVGMALRLAREMPAPGEPPKPRAPGELR
jgi:uncharacterized protein DUF3999